MNIGEASRVCGLGEHTLRYYERIGLLPAIRRDKAGQRDYSPDDLRWLDFLVKLRATGMPLRQMRRYAELLRQGDATLAERRRMLEAHEAKIRADIAARQATLQVLGDKIALYRDREQGTGTGCCAAGLTGP